MLQVFYLDVHMFTIVFKCFLCVSGACFECFSFFVRMLQLFYLNVSKVYQRCCTCCNMSHLPQLPVTPFMKGSDTTGVKDAREIGKRVRVAWTCPAYACNKHWRGRCRRHGHPNAGSPSGFPGNSAAVYLAAKD
jgi:hypothetical protein